MISGPIFEAITVSDTDFLIPVYFGDFNAFYSYILKDSLETFCCLLFSS
jgi:hypothetical protein